MPPAPDPRPPASTRREKLLALAGLMGILLLFFHEPILTGAVQAPVDGLYRYRPWSTFAPPERTALPPGEAPGDPYFDTRLYHPRNFLLFDIPKQVYPWWRYLTKRVREGDWPLWNPHSYCGVPLVANVLVSAYAPVNVAFYLMDPDRAFLVTAFLKLLVAGFGMVLLCRHLGAPLPAAFLGGVALALGGFLIGWMSHEQSLVVMWLPLGLLAALRLAERPTLARTGVLALAAGAIHLGGHPAPTGLHVLSALAFVFAATVLAAWRRGPRGGEGLRLAGRAAAGFAAAQALGFAIAGVQNLPFLEYLRLSTKAIVRGSVPSPLFHLHPLEPRPFLALLDPRLFGDPIDGGPAANLTRLHTRMGTLNYNDLIGGYVGLTAFLLAILALVSWRRARGAGAFAALGVIAGAYVMRLPPVFNLIHSIPVFLMTNPLRAMLLVGVSLAVLAAFGARVLLQDDPPRRALRWLGGTCAVLGLATLAASWWLPPTAHAGGIWTRWVDEPLETVLQVVIPREHEAFRAELWARVARSLHWLWVPGTVLAASGALFLARARGLSGRVVVGGFTLLLAAELLVTTRPLQPPTRDPLAIYRRPPSVRFLEERARTSDEPYFRIDGVNRFLVTNANLVLDLYDIRGMDSMQLHRYDELLGMALPAYGEDIAAHHGLDYTFDVLCEGLLLVWGRFVDLMGVRYILLALEPDLTRAGSPTEQPRIVYEGDDGVILENPKAVPRAFVPDVVQAVPPAETPEAKKLIAGMFHSPRFHPAVTAIVEVEGGALDLGKPSGSTVHIDRLDNDVVDLTARMTDRGLVVLTDTWYPGWEATVDGAPAPILRADYCFRGVVVPAGEHHLRFTYRPASFRWGLGMSVLGLVLSSAMAVRGLRRRG